MLKIINQSKNNILKSLFIAIGIVLVILISGFGYTTFAMSSKLKMIIYLLCVLYFGSLFILKRKVEFFKESFKKKKVPIPKPLTFCIFLILFFLLISFIFNKDKSTNLNSYIAFALTLGLSYLILTTFDLKSVLKVFKYTIFFLVSISIVVYLLTYITKTFFPSFYFTSNRYLYGTHFFLTNDVITGLTNSYFFKIRLSSLFWEPSVLGTMLIFALVAEIYTERDKLLFVRLIVFIIGIILSSSTAAFILAPFILFIFITEKTKNIYIQAAIVFCVFALLIAIVGFQNEIANFLVKILPDIFGKMDPNKSASSFITRLESFKNCFNVFLKKPFVGFGGVSSREEYFKISQNIVDAQTSTFGYVLSSFGLAGVFYILSIFVGIILSNRIDSFAKMIVLLTVFLISNVQGQNEILILNVLYFMPLATVSLPRKLDEKNKQNFSASYASTETIKNFLFAKNDNGEMSRNLVGSLVIKGLAILLAFVTIPVYLRYFDNDNSTYGIWIAITSVLSVVTVFDFGMGNGLKNKLIHNIATKNERSSKVCISTTYIVTALIGSFIFVVFGSVVLLLNDSTLTTIFFNGKNPADVNVLSFRFGVLIIILAISCQFFLKNINYILQAHQKNAVSSIFMVITNASLLIFALIFAHVIPTHFKVLALSISYFIFLLTPLLIVSVILYKTKYKTIRPSVKDVDFKESRSVIKTGFSFFAVQLGNLFLWSLNEFIILFVFEFKSAYVTEYTEYYKLYSLFPLLLGTVIQQPIWAAISKANAEGNKKRINQLIFFLLVTSVGIILFNLLLSFVLPFVFDLWLGSLAPNVTSGKLIAFILYSVIYTTSLTFVIILNAFSLFKTQIISAIMGIVVKTPLILLALNIFHFNIGWEIVLYANLICYLPIFLFGLFEIIIHIRAKYYRGAHNEKV